jgi:hypothetical protein
MIPRADGRHRDSRCRLDALPIAVGKEVRLKLHLRVHFGIDALQIRRRFSLGLDSRRVDAGPLVHRTHFFLQHGRV